MSTWAELEPYGPYLGQVDKWLSTAEAGAVEVSIHELNPGHAVNSYRKLVDWSHEPGMPLDMDVKRTPLAMALLQRAVGEPVLYADDQPDVPAVLDLEAAYDIMATMDDLGAGLLGETTGVHPITRARTLLRVLADYGVESSGA